MEKLKLGIPKGSLQDVTIGLFKKAGFNIAINGRAYNPSIDDKDIECLIIRAQEIPKYIEHGVLDVALTGKDWIMETDSDVKEVADLDYSKKGVGNVKLVVAVEKGSKIKSVKDLEGKRIATEFINIAKKHLEEKKVNAKIEFSWGATEMKVPGLVDAIVELTETGTSLKANKLEIIETIMESSTRLIANKEAIKDKWKKQKIDKIALLLKGALAAEEKVGLKMNIDDTKLKNLLEVLPALKKPTIAPLEEDGWLAIESIVDEKVVREIIPKLKELGAQGIIEYPLNKIVE